jgi:TRAP-type C4-dicarboxylate transport system permease small subunit
MPVISSLNAINASFNIQHGSYIDYNTWLIIFVISILLMIATRFLPPKDDSGRFVVALLALLLSITAIWASLGIAYMDYAQGASISNITNNTSTLTQNYIYPVNQSVSAEWITIVCIINTIFSFLNLLDIFITLLQRPSEEDGKKKGRGIKI